MDTSVLDPLIYEFDTVDEAESYDAWFREGVEKARKSKVFSYEKAMAHFDAQRAERLKKLKNATSA